jgi:hypothetical protein
MSESNVLAAKHTFVEVVSDPPCPVRFHAGAASGHSPGKGRAVLECRVRKASGTPSAQEVVQHYSTRPLGGADRFGPGRVTRWIQC